MYGSPCDKCGQAIGVNSALEYDARVKKDNTILFEYDDRHLFPIIGDDRKIICPGSPSRFQYLVDNFEDPSYPLDESTINLKRMIFKQMCKKHPELIKIQEEIQALITLGIITPQKLREWKLQSRTTENC